MHHARLAPIGALVLFALPARADIAVPQPGSSAQEQSDKAAKEQQQKAEGTQPGTEEGGRNTWDMEPVYKTTVEGEKPVHEDQLVGSYKQPRWSTRRRFPTTRIYVTPAGVAQWEYWFDLRAPTSTAELSSNQFAERIRTQYEFEFGIGHRLQLDFYLRTQQNLNGSDNTPGKGPRGNGEVNEEKVEMRYAFADWGDIWGNPTIYLEYAHGDGNEALEAKLLLGGDLSPRTHWGINLSNEHAFSPSEAYHNEWLIASGLSYGIVDSEFSLGGELQLEGDESAGTFFAWDALIGPSIQWRPIPAFQIDFVALVGYHTEKIEGTDKFGSTFQLHPLAVAGWEF